MAGALSKQYLRYLQIICLNMSLKTAKPQPKHWLNNFRLVFKNKQIRPQRNKHGTANSQRTASTPSDLSAPVDAVEDDAAADQHDETTSRVDVVVLHHHEHQVVHATLLESGVTSQHSRLPQGGHALATARREREHAIMIQSYR